MSYSIKEIYNKKTDGGNITNAELLIGIKFFDDLSRKLFQCGPVFRLAAKEANDVYHTFYSYAVARGLDIPKDEV